MRRAALVLPGRGSYTEKHLGRIDLAAPLTRAAERLRAELGLEPIADLSQSTRFEAARHLKPSNVALLIYLLSLQDAARAERERQLVCVLGNSMGWYTALAAAGALAPEDGLVLVQHMALLQELGEPGGQLLYPVVDEDWQPVPERVQAVVDILERHPDEVFPSIHLGGYAVLAASEPGLRAMLVELPKLTQSRTSYPLRLMGHGPYHSPLARGVAERAGRELARLPLVRPRIPLIDGRGRRHSPWSADLAELRAYTLGTQVVTPYDFTTSLRVALREYAPAELALCGPGNTLGGVCGQIACREGWRGIRTRADFEQVQASADPLVWSMDR